MNEINTPWGSISTDVRLFPIYYLIFIYGFLYILPFGENIVGLPWFYFFFRCGGPPRRGGALASSGTLGRHPRCGLAASSASICEA